MLGSLAAAVFVLSIGGCAVDDPPPEHNATDTSAISASDPSIETPGVVQVPDELSFQNLPDGDTSDGNATIVPDACSVTLEFCRDSRHGGLPSFCSNGCTADQALTRAIADCRNVCGPNAACTTFFNLGGC
jgi:hypothetical protein